MKYNKIKRDSDLQLLNLYEAYTIGDNYITVDTTALQVLCIGNSITNHPPLKGDLPGADSLWRGNWGMCASRAEKDYVHQLEVMLRQYNSKTSVTTKTIWEWEAYLTVNKDSLLKESCQGKDLIILKVGENVRAEKMTLFEEAFNELVNYCLQFTPNVIVAGCFWKSPIKEKIMIASARRNRLPYVPLFWIYESYKNESLPNVGDTIYDTNQNPYPIASDFICTHPNDIGMSMIAEAIFNKIHFLNRNGNIPEKYN